MTASSALRGSDPAFIGPYRIVRRLGAGGQGIVYLGTDDAGTPVAVKVLRPEIAADETTRSRFAREVAIARRVASFCTAQFLAADLWSDPPYIVTEYVDGPSLQEEVARNGPRTGAALHRLAVGTATALTAIHEAGLVHRDFKPGNVLLGADGPRVIDFGIARALDATATVSSQVVGTPAYMAPEQIKGAEIGPAADVFAWGAVVAFAATGRSPFAADSTHAVLYRVIGGEPDIAGVPDPLRALVARCLAKEPAERPTMREVLMWLLGSADSPDRETGPRSHAVAARRRSRRTLYAAVAGAAVLALAGGSGPVADERRRLRGEGDRGRHDRGPGDHGRPDDLLAAGLHAVPSAPYAHGGVGGGAGAEQRHEPAHDRGDQAERADLGQLPVPGLRRRADRRPPGRRRAVRPPRDHRQGGQVHPAGPPDDAPRRRQAPADLLPEWFRRRDGLQRDRHLVSQGRLRIIGGQV
ncbi:serine/threonine-protein kinase [Microbispora sp. GKU 823]|uniref:serine/threonine-protein kinase n=1 Tax=Microbispora sp. GKU 823 TaxID=1652100 RepID=UPI0009CA28A1|nr:serine/threonine-protein kinase [Microbispora sp. GKU 823]OPG11816.1 hypothetical protein B1L11_18200 [Microbispora sp. GKU 823]